MPRAWCSDMSTEKSAHPKEPRAAKHIENTTDATRGEPLAARAYTRKAELQAALEKLPVDELRARNDIEMALGAVAEMLTGNPDHLADATAASINQWLESTKHLAELAPKPKH